MLKKVNKKRVARAIILTVVLIAYITLYNVFSPLEGATRLVVLIISCIALDYVLLSLLGNKKLRKYFYKEGL